ncbi:hypothetical protein [Pseudomonas sp. IT-196MI5]|uniref:hypothetical protein n=1 Tax=Pseudomonas sp. IT-196MI5 TaxID=3026440 RepID=UPI0039E17582
MSKITLISGDFLTGDAEFRSGLFILKSAVKPSLEIKIPTSKLETLEAATEEIVNKKGSAIRWSLAGALLLGPVGLVGLVAGWWLCDKEKEITFYAKFKDGRCLLATTDVDTYAKISVSPLNLIHRPEQPRQQKVYGVRRTRTGRKRRQGY